MSEQDLIKRKLEQEPLFRERKNRHIGFALILKERHGLELSVPRIAEIIQEADTMDRAWRKTLKDNEHLRGSDYEDKVKLSQNKQLELGYEVGYNNNIKSLKEIE